MKPILLIVLICAATGALWPQAAPPAFYQPPPPAAPPQAQPAQPQAQQAGQAAPAGQPAPGTQPGQASQAVQVANPQPHLADSRGFLLGGVSLNEMIDVLAKMMKINYILDPRVKGSVTIYTYGEVKPVDLMPLMETILRVNGAAMIKVGDLYRIVPINAVSQLPLDPVTTTDPKALPDDERMILNLIFLKYTTAAEMDKLLSPFYGEGASHSVYEPANLLILEDNTRNMKRTMELISMFDADTFAGQRVRLYDVSNSRPTDLVKELDSVFKAYALSEKGGAVKFIPVDRINTIIAVAPNPGVFTEVQKWIGKLDVSVKTAAGSVNNYVYRLKYGRAETMAMAIMALYSGDPMALAQLAMMSNMGMGGGGMIGSPMGMGGGGMYGGMGGMNGMYGGMGGYGGYGYGGGGMGGMYNAGYGGYGGMGGGYGGYNPGYSQAYNPVMSANPAGVGAAPATAGTAGENLTGSYMGYGARGGGQRMPHIVPNPFDNTLLIQSTVQEWEQIQSLVRQLDVAPRQVLIDAKIYEVDLTGAFALGVESTLTKYDGSKPTALTAAAGAAGLSLTAGALVLRSRELLATLTASENTSKVHVVATPSIIASDSIPATMNVGQSVPTLTSQAVAGGVQSGGNSVFANSISNVSTGTTLAIMAYVNSSGVVTMIINQNVSQPEGNTSSNIDSPSFQQRSFSTQVTVNDGDTVAIGGFIGETNTESSSGIPLLHRLPIVGPVFGTKSYSKARTELVVFLTPRVIYDTNQIQDATDEIKKGLKKIQQMSKEDQ